MISIIKKLHSTLKNKKLDNIQAKANQILRTGQDDADKQQRLMNLAREIGIPIDSSDVFCRRLSYSELFDRINSWIKDRRRVKYTRINVWATCITASTAMVAVVVSIFIHWHTRQLLAPTERPIISIVDSKCIENTNDVGKLEIILNLFIKNVGSHPAENIRVRIWVATFVEPNDLKSIDFTVADTFFPDIQESFSSSISIDLDRLKDQEKKVFFYVRMDYRDAFITKMEYIQGSNLVYKIGRGVISRATLKEKEIFHSHLKEVGAI